MRRILIEINHPGQVHLIKHVYNYLINNGHHVWVITKKDKLINHLLDFYQIPYTLLGKKGNGLIGKLLVQLKIDFKALKIVKKHKIQLGLGSSMTNDHISLFVKSFKSIHLSDDDESIVPLISRLSYPFCDTILAPDCVVFNRNHRKVIGYKGYHELAYLHPNHFNPDPSVLVKAGLNQEDRYFILRFVALKGHHDIGQQGITFEQKRQLIELLEPYGKIFITSEKKIEPEFEKYRIPIAPEQMHSFIFYSDLFLGDSQTMTTEAALLGVPAIKFNSFAGKLSVPNQLEEYKLSFAYRPGQFSEFTKHVKKIVDSDQSKAEWMIRSEQIINDKIDVSRFIAWFVEHYPDSELAMRTSPDKQFQSYTS